jgi:hypothetical protein
MARVITFSRQFQTNHPRKGEPTYFVEQIYNSIYGLYDWSDAMGGEDCYPIEMNIDTLEAKHHTIRQGYRWKVGDKFSPRVWSGKPYQSKQIIIAPDIEIKKIWDVEIFMLEGRLHAGIPEANNIHRLLPLNQIAKNDGLTFEDMRDWFNVKEGKHFHGQILCWNENIEY